jgi:hypothetical protein
MIIASASLLILTVGICIWWTLDEMRIENDRIANRAREAAEFAAEQEQREAEQKQQLQKEKELNASLASFASTVVPESQSFLKNTALVKLIRSGDVTLKMSVHLEMRDSYNVEVLSPGFNPHGVINTTIQAILDSDPLGRKNIPMGSPIKVPLECKYRDGVWEIEDTLGEVIAKLERTQGFNNPEDEFNARMDSLYRRIERIGRPTGL